MNRPVPDVDREKPYSIKEICYKLFISRETIRKYTNLEMIVPIRVTSREVYYLGSEVLVLHSIITKSQDSQ